MTKPFALTPPPDDRDTARGADAPKPERKLLRQRRLYWIPAGEWVGFGPDVNAEPDLFESVHRFAWWRVHVCRYCLLAAIKKASAWADQAEALLMQPRKVPPKKEVDQ